MYINKNNLVNKMTKHVIYFELRKTDNGYIHIFTNNLNHIKRY